MVYTSQQKYIYEPKHAVMVNFIIGIVNGSLALDIEYSAPNYSLHKTMILITTVNSVNFRTTKYVSVFIRVRCYHESKQSKQCIKR